MITKPAPEVGVGLQGDQHAKRLAQWLAQSKSSKKPSCCQPSTLHLRTLKPGAMMPSWALSLLPRTMLGKHRPVIKLCLEH